MADELQDAQKFAQQNLSILCEEILEWKDKALLRDGKLRQMAEPLKAIDKFHTLQLAENIVVYEALKVAVEHGK